jgi:hypothetical protein
MSSPADFIHLPQDNIIQATETESSPFTESECLHTLAGYWLLDFFT